MTGCTGITRGIWGWLVRCIGEAKGSSEGERPKKSPVDAVSRGAFSCYKSGFRNGSSSY